MTEQERSAAREAVRWFFNMQPGEEPRLHDHVLAMHAVLTKHEADLRKRIADEIVELPDYYFAEYLRERVIDIVNPPKPVLCEGCGHTETAHVSVMLNGERVLLCSDAKFAPAEKAAR